VPELVQNRREQIHPACRRSPRHGCQARRVGGSGEFAVVTRRRIDEPSEARGVVVDPHETVGGREPEVAGAEVGDRDAEIGPRLGGKHDPRAFPPRPRLGDDRGDSRDVDGRGRDGPRHGEALGPQRLSLRGRGGDRVIGRRQLPEALALVRVPREHVRRGDRAGAVEILAEVVAAG
jgi:hypothetical protein